MYDYCASLEIRTTIRFVEKEWLADKLRFSSTYKFFNDDTNKTALD